MENKSIEQQIQELNQKLDFITDYLREQQRRQREWLELKDDLTVVGKDIFQTAVEELDEVAHHFDTADLMYLLKKLLRNTRTITGMLDQVESVADFIKDATPLSKQIFTQILETLSELEKKGYFEFARESVKILDTIVTSFTVEDLVMLRENITSILMTIKQMTQPQMLSSVNNALNFFQKMETDVEQKVSYWQLIKEISDPEFRRGLLFTIHFMKNMVHTNGISRENNQIPIQQNMKKEE